MRRPCPLRTSSRAGVSFNARRHRLMPFVQFHPRPASNHAPPVLATFELSGSSAKVGQID